MTLKEKAITALYDYMTRAGATAKSAYASMKKDGFTAAEIKEAAVAMGAKTAAIVESEDKTFLVTLTEPAVKAYTETSCIGPATDVIHLPETGEPGSPFYRPESWQADLPTWDQDTKPVITGFSVNGSAVLPVHPNIPLCRGVTARITFPVRMRLTTVD